LNKSDGQQL
jgi:hypothetical protein